MNNDKKKNDNLKGFEGQGGKVPNGKYKKQDHGFEGQNKKVDKKNKDSKQKNK